MILFEGYSPAIITPMNSSGTKINFEKFKEFVHASFAMRRKTLINNLMSKLNFERDFLVDIFNKLDFSVTIRPEDLSVEKFIELFNYLFKY